MNRTTGYLAAIAFVWPVWAQAQNTPATTSSDAERNAFQTPTAGKGQKGEPGYVRDTNPMAASQGPATNSEGKNITEPTNRPSKPSPNSPQK